MKQEKPILKALKGQTLPTPPVWMMRQAGRYLPEYRATRAEAGGLLNLCYNSDLSTEVTLQPIRRYGFDASILFADILLLPQALGADLEFITGKGPRMSTVTTEAELGNLARPEDIHETLAPIYQTVRNLSESLPSETTLIGFAGAPWTVATYLIEGQGTPDKAGALKLLEENPSVFDGIINLLSDATILYLDRQIQAGAEVIKLFDSWAGALSGSLFEWYCVMPHLKIVTALREMHPEVPIIGFPRGANKADYKSYVDTVKPDGLAIDTETPSEWAAKTLQPSVCIQGNLDQSLLVSGGQRLVDATQSIVRTFQNGPHIFNLGHGITPDASPDNVSVMLESIRALQLEPAQ